MSSARESDIVTEPFWLNGFGLTVLIDDLVGINTDGSDDLSLIAENPSG